MLWRGAVSHALCIGRRQQRQQAGSMVLHPGNSRYSISSCLAVPLLVFSKWVCRKAQWEALRGIHGHDGHGGGMHSAQHIHRNARLLQLCEVVQSGRRTFCAPHAMHRLDRGQSMCQAPQECRVLVPSTLMASDSCHGETPAPAPHKVLLLPSSPRDLAQTAASSLLEHAF